jgi:Methyltransferase domain
MHLSKLKPRTKQSLGNAASDDEEESSPSFTFTRRQERVPKQPQQQQPPTWCWFLNCTIPFHIHVALILGSNVLVYCLCSYCGFALSNRNNIVVPPGMMLNEVEKIVKQEYKSQQPGEEELSMLSLSSNHSLGYFTDISNDDWRRFYQQPIVQRHQHKQNDAVLAAAPKASHWKQQRKASHGKMNGDVLDAQWLFEHYNPVFVCPHARKIGNPGGKWMCDPERFYQTVLLRQQRLQREERKVSYLSQEQPNSSHHHSRRRRLPCLVYSVGSHGNFRWEDDLIDVVLQGRTDLCEIHIFDPFPLSHYYQDEELQRVQRHLAHRNMHYHAWGWIGTNTTHHRPAARLNKKAVNFKTLPETRRLLGHDSGLLTFDILKMDCEGCEWETSFDWLNNDDDGIHIRHLLLETHSLPWSDQIRRTAYYGPFPAMNVVHDFFERLLRVSPSRAHKDHHESSVLKKMRNEDGAFVLYSKEVNTHRGEGRCVEWSFLRLRRDFFVE